MTWDQFSWLVFSIWHNLELHEKKEQQPRSWLNQVGLWGCLWGILLIFFVGVLSPQLAVPYLFIVWIRKQAEKTVESKPVGSSTLWTLLLSLPQVPSWPPWWGMVTYKPNESFPSSSWLWYIFHHSKRESLKQYLIYHASVDLLCIDENIMNHDRKHHQSAEILAALIFIVDALNIDHAGFNTENSEVAWFAIG